MKPTHIAAALAALAALALASAAPPKATAALLSEEKIDAILSRVERFDAVEEDAASPRDLLDRLSKATGLPIEVAARVFNDPPAAGAAAAEARIPVRLPASASTVGQRLERYLAAIGPGLTFLIRRGHVEVTTAAA